jgi:methanogenic corrinoid protein MtbC1
MRILINQIQPQYARQQSKDRQLLILSGPGEADELSGQLVADLAEAEGYKVQFAGGGVAEDEILHELNTLKPDVLLLFASAPSDAPNIRHVIDAVRFGVGDGPANNSQVQIFVGGGVFNRAEGLAEEIGADAWARTPQELLHRLVTHQHRRATEEQRTVGRNRKLPRAEAA